ncbi:Ubiquitin-like domain-containing CTD phosphatase [Nymphaea thermarum]|nr:Ubiquitin-like domain-containing CTD phosphatase [Nymphaea thermarum]
MASASASGSSSGGEGWEEMTLCVKWNGKEYTVRVCADDTVGELKRRICEATTVLPKRQKLLYPKVGPKQLSDDATILSTLQLKPTLKMTMIGTVEDEIFVDQVDGPEIIDDFELVQEDVTDIKDKDVNQQKLKRRISQYKTFLEEEEEE